MRFCSSMFSWQFTYIKSMLISYATTYKNDVMFIISCPIPKFNNNNNNYSKCYMFIRVHSLAYFLWKSRHAPKSVMEADIKKTFLKREKNHNKDFFVRFIATPWTVMNLEYFAMPEKWPPYWQKCSIMKWYVFCK